MNATLGRSHRLAPYPEDDPAYLHTSGTVAWIYSACGLSRRTSRAGLSSRRPTKTV